MKRQLYILILVITVLLSGCNAIKKDNQVETEGNRFPIDKHTEMRMNEVIKKYEEKPDKEFVTKILECNVINNGSNPRSYQTVIIYKSDKDTAGVINIDKAYQIGNLEEIKGNYYVEKTFGENTYSYIVSKELIEQKK